MKNQTIFFNFTLIFEKKNPMTRGCADRQTHIIYLTSCVLLSSASSSSRLSSLWSSSLCKLCTRSVRAAIFLLPSTADARASSICSLMVQSNHHHHCPVFFFFKSQPCFPSVSLTCRSLLACSDSLSVFCRAASRLCVLL